MRPARVPAAIRRPVLLGALGLALTVPFSAPDGTGMQWDELVLAAVAVSAAWSVLRRAAAMDRAAARPWRPLGVGLALFAVAQLLAGSFPGPAFDGFGADDVLVFVGAFAPLWTCAVLARQVDRTRWTALLVDGAMVTVALLVVTEVLRTPLRDPVGAPEDLRSLVLAYGAYAALMLGGAGVLCTVSTASLRRSASTMMASVGWMVAAAVSEAMAIVDPDVLWVYASDLSVVLGLQTAVLAALRAPLTRPDRATRATAQVSPAGMALVVFAVLALPVALVASLRTGDPLSDAALVGLALVFVLAAARLVLRIGEEGRITEDLVHGEEDFRDLVESSSDGVVVVDGDLRLLFTSPAARSLLGAEPVLGKDELGLLDVVAAEDRDAVRAAIASGRSGLHFRIPTGDDGRRELEASTSARPGSTRRVLYLRDVTTHRRRERELERMAYTDHLTGLANRAMLFREMGAPASAAAAGRCLLVLDLDGFKTVNDVAGHEAGDQLLVEVARRLHTVVRDDDLVARMGGDEFAVLLAGALDEGVDVAQRVVDALAVPHRSGEWAFAVGASVGVTVLREGGGQLAFREADAALRAAKQAGKGCVRVAGEGVHGNAAGPDLAAALATGSLELRYATASGPDGAVALLSAVPAWEHGVLGTVPAHELWTAAERQGRTADLVRWVLRTACAEVASTDDALPVVVGLPPGHWSPEGLSEEIAGALAAAGLGPDRLVLALTEEILLTSSAALLPELRSVQQAGVRLMLDDYGMGHSIFALLARMPLDAVRVDLASLAVRDDTDRALRVLTAIARTAREFGLVPVADGIDDPAALGAVRAAGIDLVQGRLAPAGLRRADLERLLAGLEPVGDAGR